MSSTSRLLRNVALPAIPALLGSSAAHAQIVYTNVPDLTITTGAAQIYFDLGSGGGTGSSSTSTFAGSDFRLSFDYANTAAPYIYAFPVPFSGNGFAASEGWVVKFSNNASIFSGPDFQNGNRLNDGTANDANWPIGTTGYLALRLDVGASNYNYGWAQVTYGAGSLTLHDFAYEQTVNTAILAGAIPEPSTYAALAGLLAGGAVLYKRRKARLAA